MISIYCNIICLSYSLAVKTTLQNGLLVCFRRRPALFKSFLRSCCSVRIRGYRQRPLLYILQQLYPAPEATIYCVFYFILIHGIPLKRRPGFKIYAEIYYDINVLYIYFNEYANIAYNNNNNIVLSLLPYAWRSNSI